MTAKPSIVTPRLPNTSAIRLTFPAIGSPEEALTLKPKVVELATEADRAAGADFAIKASTTFEFAPAAESMSCLSASVSLMSIDSSAVGN
ncbi:MAG: hypothetical protein ABIS03_02480 [Gemmatimonadaceae bacterium]